MLVLFGLILSKICYVCTYVVITVLSHFWKQLFFDSVWLDEIKPYLLLSEVQNTVNNFPNLVWGAGKTSGNSLTNDNSQVLIHNILIFSKNQRKPMSGSLSQSWYYYHVGAVLFSWFSAYKSRTQYSCFKFTEICQNVYQMPFWTISCLALAIFVTLLPGTPKGR